MKIVQDLVDFATGKRPESLLAAEAQFGRKALVPTVLQILGILKFADVLLPVEVRDQPQLKSRWLALLASCPDLQSVLVLNDEEFDLHPVLSDAEKLDIGRIARLGPLGRLTIYKS